MSYAIQGQVEQKILKNGSGIGAKGSPSMSATGSRMAFGYGANYDSTDKQVGQGDDEMKIATRLMADYGVKIQVINGVATGVALDQTAINILKDNLGRMSPQQQLSTLKIIAAFEYPPAGGVNAQVGLSEAAEEVGEAAISAVPGGSLVLSVGKIVSSVGSAFKSLFGGPSKADGDRKAKIEAFFKADGVVSKSYYPLTAAFNAKGAAYDLAGYRPTGAAYTLQVFKSPGQGADWVRTPVTLRAYTLPDPSKNDPQMVSLLKAWQDWVYLANSIIPIAKGDTTQSRTQGAIAVDYFMGNPPYNTGTNAANRGGASTYGKSIAQILSDTAIAFYKRFAQLYDDKGQLLPTPADVSIVAGGLSGGDPNGQNLGNGITTGQTQVGKTEAEILADLAQRAAAMVVKEGQVVPAGQPFTVGHQIGVPVVRSIKPGDKVTKGEMVVSSDSVKVEKGVVQKAGLSTGKMLLIGGSAVAVALAVAGSMKMFENKK